MRSIKIAFLLIFLDGYLSSDNFDRRTGYSPDRQDRYRPKKSRFNEEDYQGFAANSLDELDSYDQYDQPIHKVPLPQKGPDSPIVTTFIQSFRSKTLVSLSSAALSVILMHVLLMMMFSHSSVIIVSSVALSSAVFTFIQGDIGNFCRALGVFFIIMLKGTTVHKFIPRFVSQGKAAISLSPRRPFPSDENPWKYKPYEDDPVPDFSMSRILLVNILWGTLLGWVISKPIPLFPGWLGAISGASVLGYTSTLQDSKGDFFRLIGVGIYGLLSHAATASEDVELKEKTGVLLGRAGFFLKGVDQKYKIIDKFKVVSAKAMEKLTIAIASLRGESFDDEDDIPSKKRGKNPRKRPPPVGSPVDPYSGVPPQAYESPDYAPQGPVFPGYEYDYDQSQDPQYPGGKPDSSRRR